MKKLFCFLLCIYSIFSIVLVPKTEKVYASNKPIFLLGNAEINQVLEQSNAFQKTQIASITKLMTAYVCYKQIQNGKLTFDQEVLVSEKASMVEPSKAGIIAGKKYNLEILYKTMLIKSANDCAIAIAEHISGNENEFAKLMNKTAIELGMKSTNYTNASGLSSPNQYSTAYDQYLLFQEIIKNINIVEILKTPLIEFDNGLTKKVLYSTNQLLNKNIIGKTGYTLEAKNCFCGCNISDDNKFIFITFGNESSELRFNTVEKAILCANQQYKKQTLVSSETFSKEIKLAEKPLICKNAQEFSVFVKNNAENKFIVVQNFNKSFNFPITKGEKIGESLIIINNKIIKRVDIVAENDVKRVSIFTNIKRIVLALKYL